MRRACLLLAAAAAVLVAAEPLDAATSSPPVADSEALVSNPVDKTRESVKMIQNNEAQAKGSLTIPGPHIAGQNEGEKKVADQESLSGVMMGADSATVQKLIAAEKNIKKTQDKIEPTKNRIIQLTATMKSLEASIEKLRPAYMRTYHPVIQIGNDLLKVKVERESLEVDRDMEQVDVPELETKVLGAEKQVAELTHKLAALQEELKKTNPAATMEDPNKKKVSIFVLETKPTETANTVLHSQTEARRAQNAPMENKL